MRLLLVEDDAVFAKTLARTLRRQAHEAVIAADADTAWMAVQQQSFEAVILDLRLGEDNGLALIKPLLARDPALRILVLTGYASIATAIDAIKRGAFNYLPKPATARQILEALTAEPESAAASSVAEDDPISLRRLEWEHIQHVLAANDYNVSATARVLGMHRRTLQRKLAKKPGA